MAMAPCALGTHQIVPAWACVKLRPEDSPDLICTLPSAYATAFYALNIRAQVQRGETVFIHCGASPCGMAAILLAKSLGSEVYATVHDESEKKLLMQYHQIRAERIFYTQDGSFVKSALKATKGYGMDVVLNILPGEMIHDTWRICSSFGRFVELGNQDLFNVEKFEMGMFKRGISFSAVDLEELYKDRRPRAQEIWTRLLTDIINLYWDGYIHLDGLVKKYDVSDVTKAFRDLASGKSSYATVSLEQPKSLITVTYRKCRTTFNPSKTYIITGGLGGLGTSIARWMLRQSARRFVVIGRSDPHSGKSKAMLRELERLGAFVKVLQGDVTKAEDVDRMMLQIAGPIGGIVHAAMGLSEVLFSEMSAESWHMGIDAKVQGCWNLHNAIQSRNHDLDFFLLTSSVSGSVGAVAQSNYCAANHFLDSFARYRRSLGLPAVSVGLGMITDVGYLSKHPEIEAKLSRSGISALNEEEMLQVIDYALTPLDQQLEHFDICSQAHVLTGLENLDSNSDLGFGYEGTPPFARDPRMSILLARSSGTANMSEGRATHVVSSDLTEVEALGSTKEAAIASKVLHAFSRILEVDAVSVDTLKSLADYGIDSVVATEVRTCIFSIFKIDLSLFEILSKHTTIEALTALIVGKLTAGGQA